MANPGLIKTYTAGGTIAPRRLVKYGANDGEVLQAAAATDLIIGVSGSAETHASGERIDVILSGSAEVDAAGVIARGSKVVSDANGKAVIAAPAAGSNVHVAGFVMVTSAANDIVDVFLSQAVMQG